MSFSVPPPEPPAIVQTLPPEASFTNSCRDAECNVSNNESSNPRPQQLTTTSASEKLEPENSTADVTDNKSTSGAALLGPPISVGYKLQPTVEYKIASPQEINSQENVSLGVDGEISTEKEEVISKEPQQVTTNSNAAPTIKKSVVSKQKNSPEPELAQTPASNFIQSSTDRASTNQPTNSEPDQSQIPSWDEYVATHATNSQRVQAQTKIPSWDEYVATHATNSQRVQAQTKIPSWDEYVATHATNSQRVQAQAQIPSWGEYVATHATNSQRVQAQTKIPSWSEYVATHATNSQRHQAQAQIPSWGDRVANQATNSEIYQAQLSSFADSVGDEEVKEKENQKSQIVTSLKTRQRGGETKEFDFSVPQRNSQTLPEQEITPEQVPSQTPPQTQTLPEALPSQTTPPTLPEAPPSQTTPPTLPEALPSQTTPPTLPEASPSRTTPQAPAQQQSPQQGSPVRTSPFGTGGVIELTADRQQYDEERQVITAEGNVVLRFQQAVLDADRIQVNLPDRIIVAEGEVALRRGEQVLRGSRFEYYFVQDSGNILSASGEIYVPRTGTDFSTSLPTDVNAVGANSRPLSDRVLAQQPVQNIGSPGSYNFVIGGGRRAVNLPQDQEGGSINRLRFQAEKVDFDSTGWRATNLRVTNDPFSPPELELRADTARYRNIQPLVDEITTTRSRVVFDQGLTVPTFRNRLVIDRREREPPLVTVGYDAGDRGGVFIRRGFEIFSSPTARFTISPEVYVQRSFQEGGFTSLSNFGLRSDLDVTFSPRTTLTGNLRLTTLDPNEFETKARANLSFNQIIGTQYPHTFNVGYSYRERIFNGSLGYRTVQSSLGAFLSSPIIPLGNTGINLNYEGAVQYINADTDRIDLLKPDRTNNRAQLYRYQGNATLTKGFLLWQGKALPATPTEGMRYTPTPIVPYLSIGTGITAVATAYSSGDTQNSLSGNVGLYGQFGHFSRRFLDYTGFNINYSQVISGGLSPFLFDRQVDNRVLSGGVTQQLWGPFRIGFQTALNLDTGQSISTDYFVEYSRRTYNIILRYNPILEIGSLNLRVNDFNWTGNPGPFEGTDIRPNVQGVTQ